MDSASASSLEGFNPDVIFDRLSERIDAEGDRTGNPEGFAKLPKMPTARYYQQDFYDLEIEQVWKKSWVIAGHVSEIPEPGSYILFDKLKSPVIIVRADDGTINAFLNVCQHRGSPLVTNSSGKAKRFVCAYHAWTYSRDGTLVAVPDQRDFPCLNKADHKLPAVRCDVWGGLIFINLDSNAGPLADELGPAFGRLAESTMPAMTMKSRVVREVPCNWKTMRDNFSETYHVRMVHPETVAQWSDPTANCVTLLDKGHFEIALKRRLAQGTEYGGGVTVEGRHPVWARATISEDLFPNVHAVLETQVNYILLFWPDGPSNSIIEILVLGPEGDTETGDFWSAVVDGIDTVLGEDLNLLKNVQASMEGGHLDGVSLGYMERGIYWYNEEIDRRIGAERIPPDLRIMPVLQADRD